MSLLQAGIEAMRAASSSTCREAEGSGESDKEGPHLSVSDWSTSSRIPALHDLLHCQITLQLTSWKIVILVTTWNSKTRSKLSNDLRIWLSWATDEHVALVYYRMLIPAFILRCTIDNRNCPHCLFCFVFLLWHLRFGQTEAIIKFSIR